MRGMAMTELLVALLVLALLVSAALALSLAGYAATAESRRAEIAAQFGADLAERVRAIAGVDWSALPAGGPCSSPCTPERLAAQQLAEWREAVAASLPAGSGSLETGMAGEAVAVVKWSDSGGLDREFRLGIGR